MNEQGLCPICGETIRLTQYRTTNGRLIGTCGDAFTIEQWEEEYDDDITRSRNAAIE